MHDIKLCRSIYSSLNRGEGRLRCERKKERKHGAGVNSTVTSATRCMRTPEDLHLAHRAVATSDKMELEDVRQQLKMGEVIQINQHSAMSKVWKYFKLSGLLT